MLTNVARRRAVLCSVALALTAGSVMSAMGDPPAAAEADDSVELFRDPHFTRGFTVLAPKTGKVKWQSKLAGAGPWRASPTGADGRIYCISEGGDVVVLAAGEKFEELFRCSLKSRPCRSTIVAAGGSLLIRTAKELLCVRKPAGGAE